MIEETPGGIKDIGHRDVRYHIVAGTFIAPLCKHAEGSFGVVNLLARSGDSDEARILFSQEHPQDVRCVAFRVDRHTEWPHIAGQRLTTRAIPNVTIDFMTFIGPDETFEPIVREAEKPACETTEIQG